MLVTLGAKNQKEKLVDLLLECHTRIRHFSKISQKLGALRELSTEEITDGCARCLRYFHEALPLHVQDEEESLLPRLLVIANSELEEALSTMTEEHRGHELLVSRLTTALEGVRGSPLDPEQRLELWNSANLFSSEIEKHLQLEEALVFPAIDQLLDEEAQGAILLELRSRRTTSLR